MSELAPIIVIPTARPNVVLRTRSEADDQAHFDALEITRESLTDFEPSLKVSRTTVEAVRVKRLHCANTGIASFGQWDHDEYIGNFTLTPFGPHVTSTEIGYWIRSDRRNQGYAKLGARALSDFALRTANLVSGRVDPRNTYSARVLLGVGFIQSGEESLYLRYRKPRYSIDEAIEQRAFY